jgi:hypothetical protein
MESSLPLSRLAAPFGGFTQNPGTSRPRTLWVIRATRRQFQVLGQTPSSLLRRPGSLSSRRYPPSPPRPCLHPLPGSLLRCIRTLPCQENATPVLAHTDLLGAPWEESQGSCISIINNNFLSPTITTTASMARLLAIHLGTFNVRKPLRRLGRILTCSVLPSTSSTTFNHQ